MELTLRSNLGKRKKDHTTTQAERLAHGQRPSLDDSDDGEEIGPSVFPSTTRDENQNQLIMSQQDFPTQGVLKNLRVADDTTTDLTQLTDKMGTTVTVDSAQTPSNICIHRIRSGSAPQTIQVKDKTIDLLRTIADHIEHVQAFFPFGKGNQLQDVLRSNGESFLRAIVLLHDETATRHFDEMYAIKGKKKTEASRIQSQKPPLHTPEKIPTYLKQYAKPYKQIALLNYAKCVAQAGGGACDDVAALTTAYAIQSGLAEQNWVVYGGDLGDQNRISHRFTLIGDGEGEWAVFDPWRQCATPVVLSTYENQWLRSTVAFPPGYRLPEGYQIDLDAEMRSQTSLDEVVAKYFDIAPEAREHTPPSESFVRYIFKQSSREQDELPMLTGLFAADPDIIYTSPSMEEGVVFNNVPTQRWAVVEAALRHSFEEEKAEEHGLLSGCEVKIL